MKNFCNCRIGTVAMGTKVKIKNGLGEWNYSGVNKQSGKVLLRHPQESDLFLSVNATEVIWEPLKKRAA